MSAACVQNSSSGSGSSCNIAAALVVEATVTSIVTILVLASVQFYFSALCADYENAVDQIAAFVPK